MELKTVREKLAAARQLGKADKLADAAAIYQQIVNADPANRDAIGRLLVMYRKLKEYRKELAVIKTALATWQQRGKTAQDKWLKEHPGAAGAGRSILRTLTKGGDTTAAFGSDPAVDAWIKRKAFVNKRITGKKIAPASKAALAATKKMAGQQRKAERAAAKKAEVLERKEAALKRKEAAAAKKAAALERKAAAAARKSQALAKKKAALAALPPSLFIISIRYLVPLDKIDTTMPQHVAWLNKHYEKGEFLVFGRQVPRTGGIIIARGENRKAVEKMAKEDPFVKKKMATIDIVEFSASKMAKGLKEWLTTARN